MPVKDKVVYELTPTASGAELAFFSNDGERKQRALLRLTHRQVSELASRLMICGFTEQRAPEAEAPAEQPAMAELPLPEFPH